MNHVTSQEIRNYLLNYFSRNIDAKALNVAEIDEDFDFLGSGVVDSLGFIEMIAAMEEHFHISVDFEQIDPEELTILGSFCRYVVESAAYNS